MSAAKGDAWHGRYRRRNKHFNMKIKKIKPLFTAVITTAKRYVGDQYTEKNGLIVDTRKMSGAINVFQTVIAVGTTVHGIQVGDIVKVNYDRYARAKHVPGRIEDNIQSDNYSAAYEIPVIELNDEECLYLQDRDIEFVVEEYEADEGGLLQ